MCTDFVDDEDALTLVGPPKNGEVALWPNMRVVKCKYCVSHERIEANDPRGCPEGNSLFVVHWLVDELHTGTKLWIHCKEKHKVEGKSLHAKAP